MYNDERAGVGTHSGRASVQFLSITRRWRVVNAFPRQRVGTRKILNRRVGRASLHPPSFEKVGFVPLPTRRLLF
jgi:hypothetical protein